jgi:hypothetical protein
VTPCRWVSGSSILLPSSSGLLTLQDDSALWSFETPWTLAQWHGILYVKSFNPPPSSSTVKTSNLKVFPSLLCQATVFLFTHMYYGTSVISPEVHMLKICIHIIFTCSLLCVRLSVTTRDAHRLRVFEKNSVVWKIMCSSERKRKFFNVALYNLYFASHVGDDMILSQAEWPDTRVRITLITKCCIVTVVKSRRMKFIHDLNLIFVINLDGNGCFRIILK